MRRSVRFRVGLLLALSLVTAIPPLAAEASGPTSSDPLASAASLLGDAAGAAADLGRNAADTLGKQVGAALGNTTVAGLGPCSGTGALSKGSDGRVTIALFGSDYRGNTKRTKYIGERMDVIIIATLKPGGKVAAASIPRDTVYFPKAGGGTWGTNRVNSIYYWYKQNKSRQKAVDCGALLKFKKDIAKALATEIDYYAMVRMETFKALVDKVGGVKVDIKAKIVDSYYGHKGVWFPAQNNYLLKGDPKCYGWKESQPKCRSALAYVRSRHGTVGSAGNNDYRRADRQRQFIYETTQHVAKDFAAGFITGELTPAIQGKVWTNVPKSASTILSIYNLLKGITMSKDDQVNFGPSAFATGSGTPLYTYKLKLDRVQEWINNHFGS